MIKLFLLTLTMVVIMLAANIALYSLYGGGSIIGLVFNVTILYKPFFDMFYGLVEWLRNDLNNQHKPIL